MLQKFRELQRSCRTFSPPSEAAALCSATLGVEMKLQSAKAFPTLGSPLPWDGQGTGQRITGYTKPQAETDSHPTPGMSHPGSKAEIKGEQKGEETKDESPG